jgi:hypothetical protein
VLVVRRVQLALKVPKDSKVFRVLPVFWVEKVRKVHKVCRAPKDSKAFKVLQARRVLRDIKVL